MRFINPNFHVILVHYPLGVFVLGVFLELFGLLWKRSSIRTAARWMIVLGALLTIPATTSGMFAYAQLYQYGKVNDINYAMLRMHVIYMGIASVLATFCAVVGLGASDRWRKYLYLPLLLGVLGAWGLMVIGAWNAGETIFTQGTGVTISESKTLATVIKPMDKPDPSTFIDSSGSKSSGAVVSFQKDVRPIMAAACYDCHSGIKKEKGGLRLDTAERFLLGGKQEGEKIVIKGNPEASELYRRITLADDDDDVMPKQSATAHKHLTPEQTDLVGAWIAQGADFGAWTADTDPATALQTARDAEAAEAKRQAGKKIVEVMSGHDKPLKAHADFFDSVKSLYAIATKTADTMHTAGSKTESPKHEPAAQPNMMTVIRSSTPAEMMDHAGGAIQQHLVLAGFAFAAAFFALGLSIRRLHSPTLVKEAPVVVAPPPPAEGDARRTAHDQNTTRMLNPRTAVGSAAVVHHIPSARFWLLTAMIIVATASMGYWEAAGAANVLTPKGWTEFVQMMTPADPAVKLNRVGAHVALGGAFLVLSLICAMLAAFAPKRPIMLGLSSILLIAVIAGQVWMGVLLTFDKDAHDVSFFHRATAADFAGPKAPAPADLPQSPTTAPSIAPPATAPTTTVAETPERSSTPHEVTIPLPTTLPATSPSVTVTTPTVTIPTVPATAPSITIPTVITPPPTITIPKVITTAPAVHVPSVTVTAPDVTTPPIILTPPVPTTLPVKLDHPARTPSATTAPAIKKPATRPARPATRPSQPPATRPAPPTTAPADES